MKPPANATVVLAFTGPKGCGKTTAAQFIQEKAGGSILTFAGPLKKMCMEAFEMSEEQVYTEKKDVPFLQPKLFQPKEMRRVLQYMQRTLGEAGVRHNFNWMKVPANNWPVREFQTPRQILQWIGTEFIHGVYESYHCDLLGSQIKGVGLYLVDDLRFVLEYDFLKALCPVLRVIEIKGRKEKAEGQEEHASEADWKKIKTDETIDNSKKIADFKQNLNTLYTKLIEEINQHVAANPNSAIILNNILGETNVINQGQALRSGKFGFEAQK